jgi:zinc-ribbon domain
MSSATSIEDPGLRPWQFFLLAGMLSATGVVLIVAGQSPASIVVLSLTVVAASLAALGAYRAFSPLVLPDTTEVPPAPVGRTRAALEREKTLVLRSIKELEFDFAMKKVAQADFDDMSARLRARAIGLMRQLDEGADYRAEIERELQARVGGARAGIPDSARAAGDVADARPERQARRRCPCGTENDTDARFCKKCGMKLLEGEEGTEGVEEEGKEAK